MYCRRCNTKHKKKYKYCTNCGDELVQYNNIYNNIIVLTVGIVLMCMITYTGISIFYSNKLNNTKKDNKINEILDSSEWTSDQFKINGIKFSLNDNYKKYIKNGWYVDFNRYGLNEYKLNRGDKTPSTLSLNNNKYNDAELYIGFTNLSNNSMSISDCQIWAISIYNSYTSTPVEFELPGGIKYGSTLNEIEKQYGLLDEKSKTRSEQFGYVIYHYKKNNQYLDLTIYDDRGLLDMDYRHY